MIYTGLISFRQALAVAFQLLKECPEKELQTSNRLGVKHLQLALKIGPCTDPS